VYLPEERSVNNRRLRESQESKRDFHRIAQAGSSKSTNLLLSTTTTTT
jgi:hypothetical protein